jgi:hypothetical protein
MFNKAAKGRGYDGTAFSGEGGRYPSSLHQTLHFYDQKAKNPVANTL